MSSDHPTRPVDLIRRIAALAGADGAAPVDVLRAVARGIDARCASVSPRPPLHLPRLDELAAGPIEPGDARREGAAELEVAIEHLLTAADARGDEAAGAGGGSIGPRLLGEVHEALLELGHRRRRGVFYTPSDVAAGLVREVFDRYDADVGHGAAPPLDVAPPTVCDLALGGGVFLLASADALVRRGVDPAEVVERCLWGIDVDPLAAAVADAALVLWARAHGAEVARTNVACADTLLVGADAWPDPPTGGFTMVVGNPPFQNQLGVRTARTADDAALLRSRWGPAVYRYTDSAALFLLAGTLLAAPAGRVAMIVPVPVLVTGDAERVRRELLERARLEHLWIAADDVFDAGVRVGAPVLRIDDGPGGGAPGPSIAVGEGAGAAGGAITRSTGRTFTPIAAATITEPVLRASATWGALVADVFGVPVLAPAPTDAGRLGDFCTATAGFRDQYYGLRPFVVEGDDAGGRPSEPSSPVPAGRFAKLVTSGLVDPARGLWGRRTTRFDGRVWAAPLVDLARLEVDDPSLGAWTAARLVPKVVVATQTRVLEAAVDVDGEWFPSVPTIALTPPPDRLWDAAAVVLAPATSVWAMGRHVGAALSADALKVSASQLLEAPLPTDRAAWTRGAARLRAASVAVDAASWRGELEAFGAEMAVAYAAPDEVLSWWLDRLPRFR